MSTWIKLGESPENNRSRIRLDKICTYNLHYPRGDLDGAAIMLNLEGSDSSYQISYSTRADAKFDFIKLEDALAAAGDEFIE